MIKIKSDCLSASDILGMIPRKHCHFINGCVAEQEHPAAHSEYFGSQKGSPKIKSPAAATCFNSKVLDKLEQKIQTKK